MVLNIRRSAQFRTEQVVLSSQCRADYSNNRPYILYFMSQDEQNIGQHVYKLDEHLSFEQSTQISVTDYNVSAFCPCNFIPNGIIIGTIDGRVLFLQKNEDNPIPSYRTLVSIRFYFSDRIEKIFAPSLFYCIVQNASGELFYIDFRYEDGAVVIENTFHKGLQFLFDGAQMPQALLTDVHCYQDSWLHPHAILVHNKIILVNNRMQYTKLDEYTLSAPCLAFTWCNRAIRCVLANGTIEIISLRYRDEDEDEVFAFDHDVVEIVNHGQHAIVAACILHRDEFYVLLQHRNGSLLSRIILVGYNGDVFSRDLLLPQNTAGVINTPQLIPMCFPRRFVVTYNVNWRNSTYAALYFIFNDDEEPAPNPDPPAIDGGGAAGGGGAEQAVVARRSKRPLLTDDSSNHTKKAYVLDILQSMPKEDREAILTLMTPEMQEELKEDQCSVCLRKYNNTKDIGENGSIIQDTEAITATIGECGHDMCTDCEDRMPNQYIREEGKRGKRCPTCRKVFREAEIALLLI